MNQELLWKLFKHTGKIEYYLKYKEAKENTSGKVSDDWEEL